MPTIEEQLSLQNPWWIKPDAVQLEHELRRYSKAAVRWDPPALSAIPLSPGHVHTLRGPRQVGKTTTVKRLIERLIGRGEKGVVYYSFDLHTDFASIPDVIAAAKRMRRVTGPWYLFLDEISSIPDWQKGIKYAWDRGLIQEDFVLLTGSSAHDVKRGSEQLPGRRGDGLDFLQLPMSFRDFCRQAEHLDLPAETVAVHEMLSDRGREVSRELFLHFEALRRALGAYHKVGGFPAAVSDYVRQAGESGDVGINSSVIKLLWSTIAGDIARSGRSSVAAVKLLEEAAISLGSPLKWSGVANAMDVANPRTAKEYVEYLAEAFLLLMVYHWELSGSLSPQRQRKVYFIDPLLAQLAPALNDGVHRAPEDGMVENLVAVGLFRSAVHTLLQADAVPGTVAYWRSTNNRELDFLVPSKRGSGHARLPIEVKGDADAHIAAASRAIKNSFGEGIVVTRTKLNLDDPAVPRIPVAVFLAALKENAQRDNPLV